MGPRPVPGGPCVVDLSAAALGVRRRRWAAALAGPPRGLRPGTGVQSGVWGSGGLGAGGERFGGKLVWRKM